LRLARGRRVDRRIALNVDSLERSAYRDAQRCRLDEYIHGREQSSLTQQTKSLKTMKTREKLMLAY